MRRLRLRLRLRTGPAGRPGHTTEQAHGAEPDAIAFDVEAALLARRPSLLTTPPNTATRQGRRGPAHRPARHRSQACGDGNDPGPHRPGTDVERRLGEGEMRDTGIHSNRRRPDAVVTLQPTPTSHRSSYGLGRVLPPPSHAASVRWAGNRGGLSCGCILGGFAHVVGFRTV